MSLRIAHLSDLHLGFREFPPVEQGRNLRERDVAAVFHLALQDAARLRPDVVLVSGDVFDDPEAPATAVHAFVRGVRSLQALSPGVQVLAVAGESDTPAAASEPGPLAILDALPGVEAAASGVRAVRFRASGLHVLLVPFRAASDPPFPELRPDPAARHNVLVVGGRGTDSLHGELSIDPGEWDYVALGGDHRVRSLAPNVWVAGSLERIGSDPWAEGMEEKGFVIFDLASGAGEFHGVRTRPVVDLAPIRTGSGRRAHATRQLRRLVERVPGGVDGKLVRVHLDGDLVLPEEGVDAALLDGIAQRAAHLEVRVEGPSASDASAAHPAGATASGAEPESLLEAAARLLAAHVDGVSHAQGATGGGTTADGHGDGTTAGDTTRARAGRDGGIEHREARLEQLRGEAIEAEGDVEARTLEWARDRQEAETRLQSYRDRAREIRGRLRALEEDDAACPTCGRQLGQALPRLLQALREEWEMVVQDGRWWKRRRAQLEEKPADLVRMEADSLRLRASVSELSEALGVERSGRPSADGAGAGSAGGVDAPGMRAFVRHASSHLRVRSAGRLSGIEWDGREVRVVERGVARVPTPSEREAMAAALEHALDELAGPGAAEPGRR